MDAKRDRHVNQRKGTYSDSATTAQHFLDLIGFLPKVTYPGSPSPKAQGRSEFPVVAPGSSTRPGEHG